LTTLVPRSKHPPEAGPMPRSEQPPEAGPMSRRRKAEKPTIAFAGASRATVLTNIQCTASSLAPASSIVK